MIKTSWKVGALYGVIVLVMLVAVPIASAHHPVVVANLTCDGTVTYTVTADVRDSSRNNANVALIDTSGGAQPIAKGVFNTANNWSFSGSFTIATTVTSDTLTPQALGVWGDGVGPSNGPSTTITRPQGCSVAPAPAPAPRAAATPQPAASPPPASPAAPAPAIPAATQPAVAAAPPAPTIVDQPPARGSSLLVPYPVAPFTPPTPAATQPKPVGPPPASGGTSFSTSHTAAPFTPPVVKPKLVAHVSPKTAG